MPLGKSAPLIWVETLRTRVSFLLTLKILSGLVLGGILIWMALRRVNVQDIWRTIHSLHFDFVLLALFLYATAILWRILRWWLILKVTVTIRLWQVAIALVVGYAVNVALPA